VSDELDRTWLAHQSLLIADSSKPNLARNFGALTFVILPPQKA